jgi:hypothetical protein
MTNEIKWRGAVSPKMKKTPAELAAKHFNNQHRNDGAVFRSRQVSKTRFVVEVGYPEVDDAQFIEEEKLAARRERNAGA